MRRRMFLEAIFVLLALSSVAVAQPKEQPQPKEVSPKEQPRFEKVVVECPVIKGDQLVGTQTYTVEKECDTHLKVDCNPQWSGGIVINYPTHDCVPKDKPNDKNK